MTFPQQLPLLLINKFPIIQITSALLALNHLPPVALPRCMFYFILNSLSLQVLFFLFCAFSGMMNIFSSSWNTVVEETCQGLFTVEEAYQKQLPDDSYDNQVRRNLNVTSFNIGVIYIYSWKQFPPTMHILPGYYKFIWHITIRIFPPKFSE